MQITIQKALKYLKELNDVSNDVDGVVGFSVATNIQELETALEPFRKRTELSSEELLLLNAKEPNLQVKTVQQIIEQFSADESLSTVMRKLRDSITLNEEVLTVNIRTLTLEQCGHLKLTDMKHLKWMLM